MSRKKSIVEKELSNITIGGKIVMAVMLPIFAVVAGVEHIIAKLTGSTYNETYGSKRVLKRHKNHKTPRYRSKRVLKVWLFN